MTTKMETRVIEPYRGKRDFYHNQEYFQHAREYFYSIVRNEKPRSILDVGCGHALDSKPLMELVDTYVGIDPVEGNIQQAREDNPDGDFRIGFMQELGVETESFDWVWLSCVWEILPSLQEMKRGIDECLRVAKHRVYAMDFLAKPASLVDRYMMIPMQYGLTFERANYNPDKRKADCLWCIDKDRFSTK